MGITASAEDIDRSAIDLIELDSRTDKACSHFVALRNVAEASGRRIVVQPGETSAAPCFVFGGSVGGTHLKDDETGMLNPIHDGVLSRGSQADLKPKKG